MLNDAKEKNTDGSYDRLRWQILTYLVGDELEYSKNIERRMFGCNLKAGATKSFSDYLSAKIVQWLNSRL